MWESMALRLAESFIHKPMCVHVIGLGKRLSLSHHLWKERLPCSCLLLDTALVGDLLLQWGSLSFHTNGLPDLIPVKLSLPFRAATVPAAATRWSVLWLGLHFCLRLRPLLPGIVLITTTARIRLLASVTVARLCPTRAVPNPTLIIPIAPATIA